MSAKAGSYPIFDIEFMKGTSPEIYPKNRMDKALLSIRQIGGITPGGRRFGTMKGKDGLGGLSARCLIGPFGFMLR